MELGSQAVPFVKNPVTIAIPNDVVLTDVGIITGLGIETPRPQTVARLHAERGVSVTTHVTANACLVDPVAVSIVVVFVLQGEFAEVGFKKYALLDGIRHGGR